MRTLIEGRKRLAKEAALIAEGAQAARLLQTGIPRLLVPAGHRGPLGKGFGCLGGLPRVAI